MSDDTKTVSLNDLPAYIDNLIDQRDRLVKALRYLSNETYACLGMTCAPELWRILGTTNTEAIERRTDEARALLAEMDRDR